MKILFKDIFYLTFLIGFSVNTLLLPIIRKVCLNNNFLDRRSDNNEKVSIRFGGVSMLIGLFLTFIYLINRSLFSSNLLDIKTFSIIFTGISLFSFLGVLDDVYNLSPFLRLFTQITITFYIWSQGIMLNVPSEITNFLPFFSADFFKY